MNKLFSNTLLFLFAINCIVVCTVGSPASAQYPSQQLLRPPRFDDRNNIEEVAGRSQDWSISRDGALAFSILRAAATGKSTEKSGWDVWIQELSGKPAVNITQGATDGSEWIIPLWSPDGAHLTIESTRVGYRSLWLWDRATRQLRQLSTREMKHAAYVQWIDASRVLVMLNPEGVRPATSKVGEPYDSLVPDPMKHLLAGWKTYYEGKRPSSSILESGLTETVAAKRTIGNTSAAQPSAEGLQQMLLINVITNAATIVMDSFIPVHNLVDRPVLSADRRFVAVPVRGQQVSTKFYDIHGIINIEVKRLDESSHDDQLLLKLPGDVLPQSVRWSPTGSQLAFFAYDSSHSKPPHLVLVDLVRNSVSERKLEGITVTPRQKQGGNGAYSSILEWTETGDLVCFAGQSAGMGQQYIRRDLWLIPRIPQRQLPNSGKVRLLTAGMKTVPDLVRLSRTGPLVGLADGDIWRLDARSGTLYNITTKFAPVIQDVVWPVDDAKRLNNFGRNYINDGEERPRNGMVVVKVRDDIGSDVTDTGSDTARNGGYYRIDTNTGASIRIVGPSSAASLVRMDRELTAAFFIGAGGNPDGLWRSSVSDRSIEQIIKLNPWRSSIAKAKDMIIEHVSFAGRKQKSMLILPFGYEPGKKYPMISRIYPGQDGVNKARTYRQQYELLAAAGYAVLVVTMNHTGNMYGFETQDLWIDVAGGVLPAVDRAIELGVADPDRLFVEGASMGGFATFAIIEQTQRFKAGLAEAGISNWASAWGTFGQRGRYGDDLSELGIGWAGENIQPRPATKTPWNDLGFYQRNSPITYVERIQTPLLIVHNDMDIAVPMEQSEEIFSALYRLGKRAQFVRYWGEGHGVAKRVNARDLMQRRLAWYDEFGDISRDANGNMVFEGDRVKSRKGAPALKPSDFTKLDVFRPSSEAASVVLPH